MSLEDELKEEYSVYLNGIENADANAMDYIEWLKTKLETERKETIKVIRGEDFSKWESCKCGNVGWYMIANKNTGDAEQQQCEFCYTNKNSTYNKRNELLTKIKKIQEVKE